MSKEEYIVCLGKRLKALRNEKGYSQRRLAAEIDLDDRHLRRLEKGTSNPTISTLYDLAKALDIPLLDLLNIEGEV